MPIFVGLILGDFIMGATWRVIGLSTGMTTSQLKIGEQRDQVWQTGNGGVAREIRYGKISSCFAQMG